MGPIPHHMHQNKKQAAWWGRRASPSRTTSAAAQLDRQQLPVHLFGLEPGTTRDDVIRCLERWDEGDNGILNHSKAYRLQPGTGWLVPPASCTRRAR